jgi:signal transduction histidine kinase
MVVDDDPRQITAYQNLFCERGDTESALQTLAELVEARPKSLLSSNSHLPFTLLTAQQGDEAIDVFSAQLHSSAPVRVAFIDMRMPPGMNGLQTAEALRKLDSRVYIVIVTAYTDIDMDNISEVLQEDVLFVRKPFQPEEVVQIARNFCQAWARDRELSRLRTKLQQKAESNLYEAAHYEVTQSLLSDMADKMNAQSGLLAYLSSQFDVDSSQQANFDEVTGTVLGEARQLSKLINALQRLSVESDQVSVFSVRDLIEQLEALMPNLTRPREKVDIQWELSVSDHQTLHTYFSRLVLAISALLYNAEEALQSQEAIVPGHKGKIQIKMGVEDQSFVLNVIDNGIGAAPDRIDHFFGAGYTSKPGHAGMGLTMVAQFASHVGGKIVLTSDGPETGMRTQVRFPLNVRQ